MQDCAGAHKPPHEGLRRVGAEVVSTRWGSVPEFRSSPCSPEGASSFSLWGAEGDASDPGGWKGERRDEITTGR